MSTADLVAKIDARPDDLRKQVTDFIEFLLQRKQQPEPTPKKRVAGLMKGKIWIADDFDAPLDDFKPYME